MFVEGAATSREHERMLAHLAECAECRQAVFFMQPREETQPATRTPVKGRVWGRLLPVGLPAAALACGLIAVLLYIRPHGGPPGTSQQIASVRAPEIEHPRTTIAPTTNSETVPRSESTKNSFERNALSSNLSRQENEAAAGSNLPKPKSPQIAANVEAPQTAAAAPSVSVPVADAEAGMGGGIGGAVSQLPLNNRNVTNLQQLSTPADTKAAASQNGLAKKKDLPALEMDRASGQDKALAEVSGRITDPTGALISGVRISLRDAAGNTRQTTTSADGSFHLTELPAGRYELIATASGFKITKQLIELKPSELAMLQPKLDMGTTSEQVTVEAGAQTVNTEDASLSQNITAGATGAIAGTGNGLPQNAYARVFGANGDGHSVSHGKRFLSLDSTGNLLLSRNAGKKWKKIRPQWTGKAVRIELTPEHRSEAPATPKNETSRQASEAAVFLLTTDAGTVWTSKDGAHWQQQ
jgi:hypothetical protein